jgi:DNA-binding XRE family transcriptional regulator
MKPARRAAAASRSKKPRNIPRLHIFDELRALMEELKANDWALPFASYSKHDEILRNVVPGRAEIDSEYAERLEVARQDQRSRDLWRFRVECLLWDSQAYVSQHCEKTDVERFFASRPWQILVVYSDQRPIYLRDQCLADLKNLRSFLKFACRQPRPINSSPIGRRLKKVREARGLKQEVIAEKIGTTQGYVSQIETGARTPKGKTAEKCMDCIRKLESPQRVQ